ncbi:hypothetical protein ACXET9_15505 [Brachybacterium sp. DNPG3]
MIRDIIAWPGERPADPRDACAHQARRLIEIGLDWYREQRIADLDPRSRSFAVQALMQLPCDPEDPECPWSDPRRPVTGWDEMLAFRMRDPQPKALAVLARLADEHEMVLFDLHSHRVLGPEDVTDSFGTPLLDLARQTGRRREATCHAVADLCEEQRVLDPTGGSCSRRIDPTAVIPYDDERLRFLQVQRLLDAEDLHEVRQRLSALLDAEQSFRRALRMSA